MPGRRITQLAIIAFLFVGLLFTTTSALAYWRDITVSRDIDLVTIGEPVELLITNINQSSAELTLVPKGYAVAEGQVEELTLQYEIGVSRELLNTVDLHVTASDIQINSLDTYSHLVDISILGFEDQAVVDLYNDTLTITIIVRLKEPIDATEALALGLENSFVNVEDSVQAYEDIKGQQISFVLGFEIQPKQTS